MRGKKKLTIAREAFQPPSPLKGESASREVPFRGFRGRAFNSHFATLFFFLILVGMSIPLQAADPAPTNYRALYQNLFGSTPKETLAEYPVTLNIDHVPVGAISIRKNIFDATFEIPSTAFWPLIQARSQEPFYQRLAALASPKDTLISSAVLEKAKVYPTLDLVKRELSLLTVPPVVPTPPVAATKEINYQALYADLFGTPPGAMISERSVSLNINHEGRGSILIQKDIYETNFSINRNQLLDKIAPLISGVLRQNLEPRPNKTPYIDASYLAKEGVAVSLNLTTETLDIYISPEARKGPEVFVPEVSQKEIDYRAMFRRTFGRDPDQSAVVRASRLFVDGQPRGEVSVRKNIFDASFEVRSTEFLVQMKPLLKDPYFRQLEKAMTDTYTKASLLEKEGISIKLDVSKQQFIVKTPRLSRLPTPISVQPRHDNISLHKPLQPSTVSGYVNYSLAKSVDLSGSMQKADTPMGIAMSEGLYLGNWHLQAESFYQEQKADPFSTPAVRAVHDNVPDKQRFVIGQSIPPAIGFQTPISLWRVGLDRVYFSRDRSFDIKSESVPILLERPSIVRVLVNNRPVGEYDLEDGEYIITDFPLAAGANKVDITMTNEAGEITTITRQYAYDFSAKIAEELDYSISAGVLAENNGDIALQQRPLFSGYLKQSFFSPFISSAYLQSSDAGSLLGSGQSVISEWGILEANGGIRTWNNGTDLGHAVELRYAYLENSWLSFFKEVSAYSRSARFSPVTTYQNSDAEIGYSMLFSGNTNVGTLSLRGTSSYQPDTGINRGFLSSGLSTQLSGLSLSFDNSVEKRSDSPTSLRTGFTLSTTSRGLGLAIIGSWYTKDIQEFKNGDYNIGFSLWGEIQDHRLYGASAVNQAQNKNTDIAYRYGGAGSNEQLELRYANKGNDTSYTGTMRLTPSQQARITAESSLTRGISSQQWRHVVQTSTPRGDFYASLSQTDDYNQSIADKSLLAMSFSSALVFSDDKVAMSRPIGHNGFILVYPGRALRGHTISLDNGYTIDALGPVVIPAPLLSQTQFSVTDIQNFPEGHILEEKQFRYTVPYTAGYKVEIKTKQNMVLRGRLLDTDGSPLSRKWVSIVSENDRALTKRFLTNTNGTFQVGGLSPDVYTIDYRGRHATITLPEQDAMLVEADDIPMKEPSNE